MKFIFNLFYRIIEKARYQIMSPEAYARYKGVKIGNGCRIYNRNWGAEPFLISIGDRVTITGNVTFLTHDGSTWLIRNENNQRYYKYGSINIGSDVFIGMNVIIMPNINIGSNVIVGTGSIVTKNIPDNSVVVGNPAKFICSFDDYKKRIMNMQVCESDLSDIRNFEERVLKAIEIAEKRAHRC